MRVLVVDDIDSNRTTIKLLLEDFEGLEISEASDGAEAVALCKKEHFDLVFMDVMMPEIDGFKATKTIKSFDNKVMIIAVSALGDTSSKDLMLRSGAEDYITKPIQDELFFKRVENYFQIINYRNMKPLNIEAVNFFTQEVYTRSLKFNITSLQSLAEFWDYFLNRVSYEAESLEECIRIIYAYGQICLREDNKFSIVVEENEESLFITLSPLNVLSDTVIKHTLLKNYKDAHYILKDHILSFRLPFIKVQHSLSREGSVGKIELDSYQKDILSKTHFNKTTAAEYVNSTAISLIDKIDELELIEEKLEAATVSFELEAKEEYLAHIIEGLDAYIDVVDQLIEFEHFAYALQTLNQFLKELDLETLDGNVHKMFCVLFVHLIDDLAQWRNNIFILKEANDVHYLDSSLMSSCLQIQALFEVKDIEQDDEDDFELF